MSYLKILDNSLEASSIKAEFRSHVSSCLVVFLHLVCYLFLLFTFHLFESGSKEGSPIALVIYLLSLLIYQLLFPLFFFLPCNLFVIEICSFVLESFSYADIINWILVSICHIPLSPVFLVRHWLGLKVHLNSDLIFDKTVSWVVLCSFIRRPIMSLFFVMLATVDYHSLNPLFYWELQNVIILSFHFRV